MSSNPHEWIDRAKQELAQLGLQGVKDSGILPDQGNQFFPVIGYPPLTMFSAMDEGPLFAGLAQRPFSPISAYVHIPFCPTRCTFCHWITKTKSKDEEVEVYLDYLDREMVLYKRKMGLDKIPVQSVLFGGGTPTYPKPELLERLFKSFTTHFDLSACTQFSVEAEPTTLLGEEGLERLRIMKEYGVQRISLGVQSFDDRVLNYMGRAHTHHETLASIENMRAVGFENIFIDLIYGYPGQSLESWVENMLQAVSVGVDGYQLYRLRIKQHGDRAGNIIQQFQKKPEQFLSADEILLMKYLGILISEQHGYGEHQTRVFAKKEEDISHYLRDWCCALTDVAGVGVSSWSNVRGVFTQNVGDKDLSNYYNLIDQGKVSVDRGKVRTFDDEARRSFILPLKNSYVDKVAYRARTGVEASEFFAEEIAWFKGLGLIEEDSHSIRLTRMGRFVADEVTTQFFDPNYLPFSDVARPPGKKVANG